MCESKRNQIWAAVDVIAKRDVLRITIGERTTEHPELVDDAGREVKLDDVVSLLAIPGWTTATPAVPGMTPFTSVEG